MVGAVSAKQIRLNVLEQCNASFAAFGLWTHPRDRAVEYTSLDFWVEYARLAERGLFDNFFIADVHGTPDVYGGSVDAALRNGSQGPILDPVVLISAMAHVTSDLAFTVTGNATYEMPYSFARRMSTLDHMTRGRLGWNVVTGYLNSGARAMGRDGIGSHDLRYDVADEFLDGVYRLWEDSWEEGAVRKDKERGIYVDPAKVHEIDFRGEHYRFRTIHATETSPQRTPVIFQAGASPRGRAFAARHAEGIYINGTSRQVAAEQVAAFRKLVAEEGRDPQSVKVFAGVSVFVDETAEAARARYEEYKQYASIEGLMVLMSGAMGIDLSQYPLDEPLRFQENDANRTVMENMTKHNQWTLREAMDAKALSGTNIPLIGSAEEVAEELIAWADETDLDGFNISRTLSFEGLERFIDMVIPQLQERGRYKTAYSPGTFREKLFGHGPHLPSDHPATKKR
ncbi:LLM class flavin-dependent oxidoreductase [Amycolatopsis pigmentata]|uniref:LLM class flavin-dependent oxidoreductase n=1 Tax=Amycolatopsis pigmentata TaxID=450801 RepID=A0ABW5FKU3_9PSEU